MNDALEELIAHVDIDEKCRALLHQQITQVSDKQQVVWYVLLRGLRHDDLKDLCDLLAVQKRAYNGELSPTQMAEVQEKILMAMAQKVELRKRLHI